MIPQNITYIRPDTLKEAWDAWQTAHEQGKEVYYLNGGTETVTYARQNKIHPQVLIDISRLPELRQLAEDDADLVFGTALTLNELIEANTFPLLSRCASIVDHTVRNKLSLGGNVAGRLPYRETVLPFLAADAEVSIYGAQGLRRQPISEVFSKRFNLEGGEILVDLRVNKDMARFPWAYVRKTRFGQPVDYPLVTLVFLDAGSGRRGIRCAVSGAFAAPLRHGFIDETVNEAWILMDEKDAPEHFKDLSFRHEFVESLDVPFVQDQRASAEYRSFLFREALRECLIELWNKYEGKTRL
ncbi:MAG: FAD binding domain-containing protein [Spirochaetota bacterium]